MPSPVTKWLLRLFGICGLLGLGLAASPPRPGASGASEDFFGAMLLLGSVGGAITAVIHAKRYGKPPFIWGLGCFLLPYLAPWLLLWQTPGGTAALTLTGSQLEIRRGRRRTAVALDELRNITVILPAGGKWYVLFSSRERQILPIDLTDASLAQGLCQTLAAECAAAYDAATSKVKDHKLLEALAYVPILLVDYGDRSETLTLRDCAMSGVDVLGTALASRAQRLDRLAKWVAADGKVVLKGTFWHKATLSRAGYARGKKLIPWSDVDTLYVENKRDFFVLPKGVKASVFGLRKIGYGMRIPADKADLCTAECSFFRAAFGGQAPAGSPGCLRNP